MYRKAAENDLEVQYDRVGNKNNKEKQKEAAKEKEEVEKELKEEGEPEFLLKKCEHDVCLPPEGIEFDPIIYPIAERLLSSFDSK